LYQRQNRKEVEPSIEDEELDAVEAYKSCHTSSKTGLTDEAQCVVVSAILICDLFIVCELMYQILMTVRKVSIMAWLACKLCALCAVFIINLI